MARIVVIGAGVGGPGRRRCALGRSGHEVVLVERDDTPLPADPHGAFDWDRRGAPQVRHSHAFLARLRNLLRDRHPDVLDGAARRPAPPPMDFIAMLPEGMDRTPMPGDEDLVALACRRTTFEWVLRRDRADGDAPLARCVHGHGGDRPGAAAPAARRRRAAGRRASSWTTAPTLDADLVVVAGGRRVDAAAAARAARRRASPSRSRTPASSTSPASSRCSTAPSTRRSSGPIGGDLGYLKYGVFPGDNRTFSITLAVAHRRRRAAPAAARPRHVPARRRGRSPPPRRTSRRTGPSRSPRCTSWRGLLNRRRRFIDADGAPLVLGLHAVGDAHTCTNPLYGRGCSLAMVQAQLLADALDEHGDRPRRPRGRLRGGQPPRSPLVRAAVAQDRMGRPGAAPGSTRPAATTRASSHAS